MLQITITVDEGWDEIREEFIQPKKQPLQLEHSLISLSKWESIWCKPFLDRKQKTDEEIIDYVKCMTLTQNVDPEIYKYLSDENLEQVNKYIEAPMTATVFYNDKNEKGSRERITAELIYYWMVTLNIPFECQKWHLNRLLTLIRVCNIKSQKPKKRGSREIMSRNTALNEIRRKQLNTNG